MAADPDKVGGTEQVAEGIRVARRRLSVVSDNKLIEGFSQVQVGQQGSSAAAAAADGATPVYSAELYDAAAAVAAASLPKTPCKVSTYAGFSKKGFAPYNPRKKNQDALIMAEDPATGTLLLCVMDGHGEVGDKIATAFKKELAPAVFGHPHWATDVARAVAEAIARIEEALNSDDSVDTEFSGTTLVAAAIRGGTMTIINIGDSRITLGRVDKASGKMVAEPLSLDHKPETPEERDRILSAGGRVFAVEYDDGVDGPPRVWLGHMDVPGLAMSRSLGDKIAHTAGVISKPDVYVKELAPEDGDCLLILATDGLWEFMSNEECIEIASSCSQPRIAVDKLITEANERWMKEEQVIDDTTVCVAFLQHFPPQPGG
ncbi:unnamed protein product [Chrysoparadoxa australica]